MFNKVYNNQYYSFFQSPNTLYNNEIIYSFTNLKEGVFLSGENFNNSAFTADDQKLTMFNTKIDNWGDTIWQKRTDLYTTGIEAIGNVYEYPNGDLISVGVVSDNFYTNYDNYNGLVYKTDNNGNEKWHKEINFGEESKFNHLKTKNNGVTFQVLGFADVDTAGGVNYDAFISTIDSNGNLLSNIQIGDTLDDALFALEYLDNGNYLVCGYTYSYGVEITDVWLLEIEPNGTIIWQKTYGTPKYDRIESSKSLLIYNNHIYIAGRSSALDINSTNNTSTTGYLIKTDMQGNLIWEKKYQRSTTIDKFTGIQLFDENTFIIGGQRYPDEGSEEYYPSGWILKVDTNGSVIWERIITKYNKADNAGSDPHHYVYDMLLTKDKGILLGGYVIANYIVDDNGYFHRNDAWLAITDSCGYTVGDIPEPKLLIDSIINKTVYITEHSKNYCTAELDWGDGSENLQYYAYENNKPLTEKHFQHTYTDIDQYTIKTTTLAGEEYREYEVQVVGVSTEKVIPTQAGISIFPNPAQDYTHHQA